MINVSNEYKEAIRQDREFHCWATITLESGEVLNITNENIMEGGFKYEEGTSSNGSFDIGAAIIGKFSLSLDNTEDIYSKYDFTNAVIRPRIGLQLSETIESMYKGVFTVDEAQYLNATVQITALDNLCKFEKDYAESSLIYPATLSQIVQNACEDCGVFLNTQAFDNRQFEVKQRPDDSMSYLDVISFAAQIAGCYAKCNESGQLELKWYDFSALDERKNLFGGDFGDYDQEPLSGGDFDRYGQEPLFGGDFDSLKGYHHIYDISSQNINIDDVVITGVRVTEDVEDSESYLFGSDGYVLTIEGNPFIQEGQGRAIADYLGRRIVGVKFRPLSIMARSDPSIQAGDVALVTDRKGNSYQTIITNLSFKISGWESFTCDAKTPSRNSAAIFGSLTKAIADARKAIDKKISAYDQAVQMFTGTMMGGFGIHQTFVVQEDGSTILYMHDKPSLDESMTIWGQTRDGFGVSKDGGKTWTAGFDSDGNAVFNVLNVIGINAEWINGGVISGISINLGNGNFVVDASGNLTSRGSATFINAAINGGSLNLGNGNFVVDSSGNLTSKGSANFSNAKISGGSMDISNTGNSAVITLRDINNTVRRTQLSPQGMTIFNESGTNLVSVSYPTNSSEGYVFVKGSVYIDGVLSARQYLTLGSSYAAPSYTDSHVQSQEQINFDLTDQGLIVSSSGKKYLVKLEEFEG